MPGNVIVIALVLLVVLIIVYVMLYGIGWAFKQKPVDSEEEVAEELQGTLALVTADITTTPGEISYQFRDETLKAPAVSIDGASVSKGTEVVIEHIDKTGVAHVELWSVVETRL